MPYRSIDDVIGHVSAVTELFKGVHYFISCITDKKLAQRVFAEAIVTDEKGVRREAEGCYVSTPDPALGWSKVMNEAIDLMFELHPQVAGIYMDQQGYAYVTDYAHLSDYAFYEPGKKGICTRIAEGQLKNIKVLSDKWRRKGKVILGHAANYTMVPYVDAIARDTDSELLEQICRFYRMCAYKKPLYYWPGRWPKGLTEDTIEKYFRDLFTLGVMPSVHLPPPEGFVLEDVASLYQKYMPILKQLTEATWHPLQGASVNVNGVSFERFGRTGEVRRGMGEVRTGGVFWSLVNRDELEKKVTVTMDYETLGIVEDDLVEASEVVAEKPLTVKGRKLTLTLPPGEVRVIRITTKRKE